MKLVRRWLRARRYARHREYQRLCDPTWLAAIKPTQNDNAVISPAHMSESTVGSTLCPKSGTHDRPCDRHQRPHPHRGDPDRLAQSPPMNTMCRCGHTAHVHCDDLMGSECWMAACGCGEYRPAQTADTPTPRQPSWTQQPS